MIIIKLQGGLGNQMFQYAFGRALSLKLKQHLFFDPTLLGVSNNAGNNTRREYGLSLFPELHVSTLPNFYKKVIYAESVLVSKCINRFQLIRYTRQLENELIRVDKKKLKFINVFEGYFQGEKYFREFSDQVRTDFKFPELDEKNNSLRDQIISSNSVAIHIRRGDYISNPKALKYHGVLPVQYYQKAIEIVKNTQPDLQSYIFTDDLTWVKANLFSVYPEAIIVEGNTGSESWKDMALMSFAKHHIISNSSFSWWGAWLARNQGVKIAPGKWFNPEAANFDIHNIIPGNWEIVW